MDKTVRIVTDLDEQQAETYRYWQSVSDSARARATLALSVEMYRSAGLIQGDPKLDRSVVRILRPEKQTPDDLTEIQEP